MTCLVAACHTTEDTGITIRWDNKRATGIVIPKQFIDTIPDDSLDQLLTVRLTNQETAIAGEYQRAADELIFEPVVPFTRGMHYAVWVRNKRLSEIHIPALAAGDHPTLLAIYPSQDSLPDNLLKIYLHFSRPMREGQSETYVALLKNKTDTLSGVFLNLQPELWNADRTILTLWLDPGRIKRDLQPNKLLGAPLQKSVHYQIVVSPKWSDEQGALLAKTTTKTFVTIQRDSLSPNPTRWSILAPKSGDSQPLEVAFGEPLDHSLLAETLEVIRGDGTEVPGSWQIGEEEKKSSFKPTNPWQAGRYRLRIESRLEDLAGNNLNRPFDRDITRKDHTSKSRPFRELSFEVRE